MQLPFDRFSCGRCVARCTLRLPAGIRDHARERTMRTATLCVLALMCTVGAATTGSQSGAPPTVATDITAAEIEKVVSAGGGDREIKIVDMGKYNLGVAVLRR